jgi:hypothetical protein
MKVRSFEVGNQLRSTSQVLPAAMSLPHNLLSDLFAGNTDSSLALVVGMCVCSENEFKKVR